MKKLNIRSALLGGDILVAVSQPTIWTTLALHDIRQRYRRSKIGPFWFVLNNVIFVGVLGVLYSQLFEQDVYGYIPYLAAGFVTWQFLATNLSEAPNVFVEASALIKQVNISLSQHVLRLVLRNFIIFLHNIPFLFLLSLTMGVGISYEILFLPFAFLVLCINSIFVCILLGILGARFRDVLPIIQSFVTIAFFFTPILWSAEVLEERAMFVNLNPLLHFVELVRSPLLGEMPAKTSILVAISTTFAFGIMAHLVVGRFKKRVVYWL